MSFIKSEEELRQKLAELYKRQQESWNEEQTRLQEARKDVNWVSPSQLPSYTMPDRPAESEFQKFLGDVYGGSVTRMANNTWDQIKKQYDEEVYKASNQYKAMQILQEQQKQENEKRLQDFIQNSGVKAPTQNVQLPTAENSSSNMEQFRINQFNYQQQKQEDAVKQSIDTLKKNGQIRLATAEEREAILQGGEEINDKAMEKAREYADKAKRGDMSWKTELYLNSIPAGAKRDIAGLEQLGLTAGEIFAGITGNEDAEIDIRRKKQNIRARGNEYAQTREYLKRMLNAQGQGDVWNDVEDMLAGAFENTSAVAFNSLLGAGLNGSQVMANPNVPILSAGGDIGTVLQGVESGVDAFTGRQQRTNNENPVGNFIASTWEGTMNAVWEKATGGNILTRKLGKNAVGETVVQNAGWLDKYLFNAIKKTGINNKTALNVINKAWGFLGEVVEEWGTDLSTEIGNRIVLNEKSVKNLDELVAKEGETAKQTLFSTLIMNLFGMGGMKTKDIANQYGIEYGTVDDIQKQMKEYAREHNMSLTEKSVDKIMNEFMKEAGLNFNEIVNNYDELMNQKEGMEETGYPKQYANQYQERYYESAKKYNLPNNEVMQAIQELGEKRGYKVEYNADKFKNSNEESIWSKNDRTVYINPSVDSRTQLTKLAVHEMFHDTMGSDSHAKLINTIMEKLQADTKNYEKNRKSIMEAYKDQLKGLNEQQANQLIAEEMTAKYLGENLGSKAFVNELVQTTDRNTIERFIDWITNRIQQLKNIVTGNKEAEYWRGIRENLIKAYNSQYQADTQDTNINYYSKENEDYDMAESRLDRRETINYYLKKGEFEQAEKLIKEYGLEDERNEFMEGLDYGAQHEYSDYLKNTPTEQSVKALNRIDDLVEKGQHYTNTYSKEALAKKGRQDGRIDFEQYIKQLEQESYEKRNDYHKGDIIEYDTNARGTTEQWHQGQIQAVEKAIATHGNPNPDVIYTVKDQDTGKVYNIDAYEVSKLIKKGQDNKERITEDFKEFKENFHYGYRDSDKQLKTDVENYLKKLKIGTELGLVVKEDISGWTSHGSYHDEYTKLDTYKKIAENQWTKNGGKKVDDHDMMLKALYNDNPLMDIETAKALKEKSSINDKTSYRDIINVGNDGQGDKVGKSTNRIEETGLKNAYKTIINDALNKTQEGNWIFDESDLKGMDFDTFTKMLENDSRVADVEIDNNEKTADVTFYTENLPVNKSYDKIINDALENTTSGSWTIENTELEKNGILPRDFEEKLDNDERVSDYIKEKDGYDVNFYTEYTPNVDDDVDDDEYYSKKTNDYDKYLEENSINEDNLPTTDSQGNTLSKQQQKYFKNSKARDEKGKLQILYHTTPNKFTVFSREYLGENTFYDNGKYGFFVTPDAKFSERFGDIDSEYNHTERKKGNVMQLYANIEKPIIHPYGAGYKYSGEELDNIVREYHEAIGEKDGLAQLEEFAKEGDISLYDAYLGWMMGENPYEYATDEQETLAKKGYDAVIFVEGTERQVSDRNNETDEPVISYAVFNPEQLKNIDNTNPTNNEDIRYSKKADDFDEYLKATSINEDNQGHEIKPAMRKYMKNSQARVNEKGQLDPKNGNLAVVYHTTTGEIKQFFKFNPVGSVGYKFGNDVVNYYTDSDDMSDSYSNYMSEEADTRRIKTLKQAREFADKYEYEIIKNPNGTYTLADRSNQRAYDKAVEIINENFTPAEQKILRKAVNKIEERDQAQERLYDEKANDHETIKKANADLNFTLEERAMLERRSEMLDKEFDNLEYLEYQYLEDLSYDNDFHKYEYTQPKAGETTTYETKDELFRNMTSEMLGKEHWQYEGYVNITNPYIVDAKNSSWSQIRYDKDKEVNKLLKALSDDKKQKLTNLYKKSIEKNREAERKYQETYQLRRALHDNDGMLFGKQIFDNDVVGVYKIIQDDLDAQRLKKVLKDEYIGPNPEFYETVAYSLFDSDVIDKATENYIIEKQEIPDNVKTTIQNALNKQLDIDDPDIENYTGTLEQLVQDINNAQREYNKYIDESEYFVETIRNHTEKFGEHYINKEIRDALKGFDNFGDYADQLAFATTLKFDKKELIANFGNRKSTNDIVEEILESNKAGKTNYDGIIIQNVYDYGFPVGDYDHVDSANVYITFNSNQFKAIDNPSPTKDADIRYNRQAKVYDDYLKKNSINTSNEASMRDLLLPKQEQTNLPPTDVTKRKGTKPKKVKQELPVANEEVILPTAEKTQEKTQTKKATENLPTMAETIDWSEIEKPENNKKFRKFYISIINSPNTTAEAKAIAKKLLGLDTYVPDSNQKQLMRADLSIQQLGAKESLEGLRYKLLQNERISATDVAIGERLIEYASKIGDSQMLQDAIETTAIMGTQTGQALQALAILNRQTPTGQVTAIQRAVEKLNAELQMKYAKKGRKAPQFDFTNEMQQRIMKAKNTDQLYEIVDKVYKELGQQVPKTTMEQLDEWRYFSMLANARTHARNMIGNLGMHGVQRFKDKLAGLIEDTVARFNPDMERMHTLKRVDKKTKEFAKKDLERREVQSQLGMTEDKYHPQSRLQSARRVFKHNLLEKTIGGLFRLNSKALSKEDDIGLKAMYKKALGEYLTANGIDVDKITDKQLAKARNYAVEQSKKATFHQASALASAMTQLSNKNNVSKFFLDATVPFKKTPINVAKTGIEYSPIGIIKSMTYDISQVRNGNMSGAQYIDNLSKGLTGSGLMFVGYVLASMGLLKASGPEDKKKEELEDQQGKQRYSLQFGDDVSISLDWFAPSGIPFFIGAELYEQQNQAKKEKNRNENESDLDVAVRNTGKLLNSLSSAMNPMSEMSMIQGITSVLASYNQDQAVGDMITNSFKSYVGQYVPTLFGQITKTADEYERSTKSTKTGTFERAFDQTLNQIKSKLPIARQTLPIKTDIWGNDIKQTDNIPLRILNNFINPATVKEITSDDKVNSELNRLYDQTGTTSVVPTSIAKKVTIDSKDYFFNNEEYAKYQKQYGQTAHKLLENLVNSAEYKKLNNTQKARAVSNIYDYAKEKNKVDYAKDNNISGVKPSANYKALDELTDKVKTAYLTYEAKTSDLKKKNERLQVLLDSNYTDFQKRKIYEYSKDGSDDYLFQFSNEMNPDEYLSYKLADIQGEKDANGKTKSGTKKKADLNYINNNISGYYNRLVLMADNYKLSRAQQKDLANYINQADPEEAIKMFKELPLNFKVDANGRVYYK